MDEDTISGNMERRGADRLEGWCWSSARPDEPLTVELLLDDRHVATFQAGAFRRDLARAGKGNGRHAFALTFGPDSEPTVARLNEAGLISLRDAVSGRTVARIRQRRPVDDAAEAMRLDKLGAALDALAPPIANVAWAKASDHVQAGLAALGDRLLSRGDQPRPLPPQRLDADVLGDALVRHRRTLGAVRLPIVGLPALTVAVRAANAAETHAVAAAFAANQDTELLVVDDGRDPEVALLGAIVSNLALVRSDSGFAAFANAATAAARAGRLALLPFPATHRVAVSFAADASLAGDARTLVIGERVCDAAIRLRLFDRLSLQPGPAAVGDMLLTIGRAAVPALGGFDPLLGPPGCDDGVLCVLDLCLKAVLLGHPIVATTQLRAGQPQNEASPQAQRLEALLQGRWR